jgi:cytochrome P450
VVAAPTRSSEEHSTLPPGPRGLPLFGNLLEFRRDQLGYLLKLQQNYGRMATIFIGKTPVVLLFRPEHVRYILSENPGNFTSREVAGGLVFGNLLILSLLKRSLSNKVVQGLQDLAGDGLLTTDGDFHDLHRRLMQGAFSRRRMEEQAGLIVRYTREALARWQVGEEMDLAPHVQALVLRITAKILVDVDAADTELGRMIEGVLAQPVGLIEGVLNLPIDLPFTPYRRRAALLRESDDFTYSIIDHRRAEGRDAGDILSVLLEAREDTDGCTLTRKQVRDELVSLLSAGYETTTNTLLWTFYLLARSPAVLGALRGELRAELGDRDPDVADLTRLTYLDWVVKESMRLYPSAWTQGRQAVDGFDLDGTHFPAGTLFMFSQWVLHRLPDVWGDPDVFRPERWDPARRERVERASYFPFGLGPRSCLGLSLAQLETRLVVATVLQRLVPVLRPSYYAKPVPLVTLRLKDGLPVRMMPVQEQAASIAHSANATPGAGSDGSRADAERTQAR